MGKVGTGLSMPLDGFIAGPNDGPGNPLGDGGERLFVVLRRRHRVHDAERRDNTQGFAS